MSLHDEIEDYLADHRRRSAYRRAIRRAQRIDAIQEACLRLVRQPSDYAIIARLIRQAEQEPDEG